MEPEPDITRQNINISNINSIAEIKHAYYINLDTRPDRKAHVEEQLKKIGVKAERFNAIRLPNGALGCSMSHLKCIELAKQNNFDHIMIVEDDITFLKPKVFVKQLNYFLKNHKNWDVILIAGNNVPPYTRVDDSCIKVSRCQTTTGYIVNKHYYDKLIQNYRDGMAHLMKEPDKPILYAIDKYWFNLQMVDNWYLITPLTVTQKDDYSDIEQKRVGYTHLMTDLDKEWLFKQPPVEQLVKINDKKSPNTPTMHKINYIK
jgi:glycosyl transferase family 25